MWPYVMYTDLLWVNWGYEIHKFTEEIWESWLLLTGLQCDYHWWHKNGNYSYAKHWKKFVFWFTATWNASFGYVKILWHWLYGLFPYVYPLKKKTNQIVSRDLGVHSWLPYLSHYLSGKLLLINSATLMNIRKLNHLVWRRKWYSHLFQSVTWSILPSNHGVSDCNCLFCKKEGLCY
jgi:hypothetical protein